MVDTKVSLRYAISLYGLAEEKNCVDAFYKDVKIIFDTINGSKDLKRVLENPVFKQDVKEKILIELFQNRIDSNVLNFLRLVVSKERESYLLTILQKFIELTNEKKGIAHAEVKSAFSLDESQLENIRTRLKEVLHKNEIIIQNKVDQSIIGGFVVRVEDTIFDASIKHQLVNLKKQILT